MHHYVALKKFCMTDYQGIFWALSSMAKWIYAVPYGHRFQVWEMPLLGFGGYLPFGMECAAVAAWISPKLIERLK